MNKSWSSHTQYYYETFKTLLQFYTLTWKAFHVILSGKKLQENTNRVISFFLRNRKTHRYLLNICFSSEHREMYRRIYRVHTKPLTVFVSARVRMGEVIREMIEISLYTSVLFDLLKLACTMFL